MDAALLETETCDLVAAETSPGATEFDQDADVFLDARPRLIEIAYRILGRASET